MGEANNYISMIIYIYTIYHYSIHGGNSLRYSLRAQLVDLWSKEYNRSEPFYIIVEVHRIMFSWFGRRFFLGNSVGNSVLHMYVIQMMIWRHVKIKSWYRRLCILPIAFTNRDLFVMMTDPKRVIIGGLLTIYPRRSNTSGLQVFTSSESICKASYITF